MFVHTPMMACSLPSDEQPFGSGALGEASPGAAFAEPSSSLSQPVDAAVQAQAKRASAVKIGFVMASADRVFSLRGDDSLTLARMRLVSCALVFGLMACRAPRSELHAPEVLRFGVGHMGGSHGFVVHEDGHASHWESGGGRPEKKVETRVTKEEMHALADALRKHDLCGKRGSSRKAVPDEARPSVAVKMEDLDCRVQMLDNDWRDDDDAREALAAIEAFGHRLGERDR